LHFDIKKPGSPLSLQRIPLSFRYDELFDSMPSAYETLFVHADEVKESWRIYTPLLDHPPAVCPYDAGSWGPAEADILSIPERALWQTHDER
ncbi:MAG: glucose-6-phosphate dehydrogenase, partial [Deltaproteobacteria bacterium]|nr:glucose-6-phosphate dehydrogenase [Deltaproteobacteria bacterium]